jgi:iron-sulfur cluster assembly protein CyaY
MTETEFIAAADALLASIGAALDDAASESDADLDWSLNDGILTIDCGGSGKVIVNRHVPNREIWVAARSGGYHFRADGDRWVDTRSGQTLDATLSRLLREQAGIAIDF